MSELSNPNQELTQADDHAGRIERGYDKPLLGFPAVECRNTLTEGHLKLVNNLPEPDLELADYATVSLERNTEFTADWVRDNLLNLKESQLNSLGAVVDMWHPPQFLLDTFGAQTGPELVRKVMATPTVGEDGQKVMNFFEWQTYAATKREETFAAQERPKLLDAVDHYIGRGVTHGILPVSSHNKFRGLMAGNSVRVEETFFTTVHNYGEGITVRGTATKFTDGSAVVGLSPELQSNEAKKEHTVVHEILHVLDGTVDNPASEGSYESKDTGLYRIFGDGAGATAVNEAVTEHTADSLIHGNMDEINPFSEARVNSTSYHGSRFLLEVLCKEGVSPVDPRLFTAAMLEEGNGGKGSAASKLTTKLDKAFPGMNVIGRIRDYKTPDGELDDVAIADLACELLAEVPKKPLMFGKLILSKMGVY